MATTNLHYAVHADILTPGKKPQPVKAEEIKLGLKVAMALPSREERVLMECTEVDEKGAVFKFVPSFGNSLSEEQRTVRMEFNVPDLTNKEMMELYNAVSTYGRTSFDNTSILRRAESLGYIQWDGRTEPEKTGSCSRRLDRLFDIVDIEFIELNPESPQMYIYSQTDNSSLFEAINNGQAFPIALPERDFTRISEIRKISEVIKKTEQCIIGQNNKVSVVAVNNGQVIDLYSTIQSDVIIDERDTLFSLFNKKFQNQDKLISAPELKLVVYASKNDGDNIESFKFALDAGDVHYISLDIDTLGESMNDQKWLLLSALENASSMTSKLIGEGARIVFGVTNADSLKTSPIPMIVTMNEIKEAYTKIRPGENQYTTREMSFKSACLSAMKEKSNEMLSKLPVPSDVVHYSQKAMDTFLITVSGIPNVDSSDWLNAIGTIAEHAPNMIESDAVFLLKKSMPFEMYKQLNSLHQAANNPVRSYQEEQIKNEISDILKRQAQVFIIGVSEKISLSAKNSPVTEIPEQPKTDLKNGYTPRI